MQHGKSHELIAYWEQLRGTRAAPERSEIAPAAIARQLADIFILQTSAEAEPLFRLAGTRICSIHGRELKGAHFAAIWRPEDHRSISRLVHNSMTGKSPASVSAEGMTARGRVTLFEFTLLPLANEANEQFLIGMIDLLGQPFWLESDPIVENRIRSIMTLDSRKIGRKQRALPLLSEPKSAIHTIIGNKPNHLQLLDGGKSSRQVQTSAKPLPRR